MITNISKQGNQIGIKQGSLPMICYPPGWIKRNFTDDSLVLIIKGEADVKIALENLTIEGEDAVDVDTALDMLNEVFLNAGGAAATTLTATGTAEIALKENKVLEYIFFVAAYPFNLDMGTTEGGSDVWDEKAITDASATLHPHVQTGAAGTLYISGLPANTIIKYKIS